VRTRAREAISRGRQVKQSWGVALGLPCGSERQNDAIMKQVDRKLRLRGPRLLAWDVGLEAGVQYAAET